MKAVLFARDAGAANHMVAVADVLAGRLECPSLGDLIAQVAGDMPRDVSIWGVGPAMAVFAAAGVAATEMQPRDTADAVATLRASGAGLLLTGTGDVDDRTTPLFWLAASELGIPSIAALDSPDNMQVRLAPKKGERPDRFVAPDTRSLAALQDVGIATSDILLVENLHLTRLVKMPNPCGDAIRGAWKVGPNDRVVLFASENAAEARAMGRTVDFDEFSLLASLIDDVGARRPIGAWRGDPPGDDIVIVVRPHPRDVPGKYDGYERSKAPRVIVSSLGTPAEALSAADLVVGMRSSLLEEARVLGKPVHRLI